MMKGLLSDVPGMQYYFQVRACAKTNFVYFRCRRSSSQLDGYHLHLRAAQHPTAKGQAGPRLEIARTDLCDFSWNQRAGRKAGQLRDHGHDRPWLVDALHDVCAGAFEGPDAPPALQGSRRLDTSLEPVTWHGINWEGLGRLAAQGAQAVHLASLRLPADVAKVLLHPLLIVRGDAAGIARETGVLTSEKRLADFLARLTAQVPTAVPPCRELREVLATWIVRAWLDARNRSLVYSNAQPHSSVTLYTLRCTY